MKTAVLGPGGVGGLLAAVLPDALVVSRSPLAEGAELLNEAGIEACVVDGEAQVMWSKLVRLNAIALTTTAYSASMGEVRERHRDDLLDVVGETAAVAAAEGATIDAAAIEQEL